MKPAPFVYHAPSSVAEALDLLHAYGEESRILAGGQTLVPAMNFRLARPGHLVDINGIGELDYVTEEADTLRVGALARHSRFEKPVVNSGCLSVLLPLMASHIAHLPVRTRGTFCGSLAHADPASEWCLLAAALDADIVVCSCDGQRIIPVSRFLAGPLMTDLQPNELVVEARLPIPAANCRAGFAEFARRAGDFALAMSCVLLELDGTRITRANVAVAAATEMPVRLATVERSLIGTEAEPSAAVQAARLAAEQIVPVADLHGSAEYRRDLAQAMTRRALMRAFAV